MFLFFFFFQAEDGIRDLVRSRGLGDVYKRQATGWGSGHRPHPAGAGTSVQRPVARGVSRRHYQCCLLYTSDAADARSSGDLGGRRILKKKKRFISTGWQDMLT